MTHWETERWYERRAKRSENNKKIKVTFKQIYEKIFRRASINKVQPV
tara:strand:- start:251 stop:391 length:141 start_codon:yes stop_codon:yes gene_type:complete